MSNLYDILGDALEENAAIRAKLTTEQMIRNRVGAGCSEEQSRELLTELLRIHSETTIEAALAYHGFLV